MFVNFYTNVNPILLYSKVSRPDKLAVHMFEVDEDVDKDEVMFLINMYFFYFWKQMTGSLFLKAKTWHNLKPSKY